MTDETTPGVLLRGADGSHYFIPSSDLSQYGVADPPPEVKEGVASTAPQVHAFSVERGSDEAGSAAYLPMPEG